MVIFAYKCSLSSKYIYHFQNNGKYIRLYKAKNR